MLYFDGKYDSNNIPILTQLNAFPTLYFDQETSCFCWKVWGNKTGLIANGPQGESGKDGNIVVCIRNAGSIGSTMWSIKSIILNNNEDPVDESIAKKYDGQLAIVLPDPEETETYAGFWVSTINKVNNGLVAYCGQHNNVLTKLSITPSYFTEHIMPGLYELFIQTDALSKTRYNITRGNNDVLEINKTSQNSKMRGNLDINLDVNINPGIGSTQQYAMSVTDTGIFITLGGVKYELVKGDGDVLKLTQIS